MATDPMSVPGTGDKIDEDYRKALLLLFKSLRLLATSNAEFYKSQKGVNEERFHTSSRTLCEHLDQGVIPGVDYISQVAYMFDFSPDLRANGYRSILQVIHKCCLHLYQLCRHISNNKSSFVFRTTHYSKELEAYVSALGQLRACLYYLQRLVSYCSKGNLFPDEESLSDAEYQEADQLMLEVETLSQEPFYGRCLGFQVGNIVLKWIILKNLSI